MSQHFLLSAAARSLSVGKVMRMSDQGAENVFARLRWPINDGKPVCPDCGLASSNRCSDFRQFSMRGLEKVRGEWSLVTMAWNMKRMFVLNRA